VHSGGQRSRAREHRTFVWTWLAPYPPGIDAVALAELRPDAPLTGRLVSVEPLEEGHREGLREAAAEDPTIFRYMVYDGNFDAWFDGACEAPAEIPFAVVRDGEVLGSTRYLNYEPSHRRVEIGWTWLRPSAWNSGANIETKMLLMQNAFERAGMQRVEFKTDARNERARRALLALGLQFEGIARKHMMLPTGPRDSAWYAATEDDWPDVKAHLLSRLESKQQ
jgi:aminoglycoside 6'-N-acetyltransferase